MTDIGQTLFEARDEIPSEMKVLDERLRINPRSGRIQHKKLINKEFVESCAIWAFCKNEPTKAKPEHITCYVMFNDIDRQCPVMPLGGMSCKKVNSENLLSCKKCILRGSFVDSHDILSSLLQTILFWYLLRIAQTRKMVRSFYKFYFLFL